MDDKCKGCIREDMRGISTICCFCDEFGRDDPGVDQVLKDLAGWEKFASEETSTNSQ